MAQVAAEYLKAAGFKVAARRRRLGDADPAPHRSGALGYLHHPQPVPARAGADRHPVGQLAGLVGSDRKHQVLDAFNAEADPDKRVALFADVQKVIYDEVPLFKIGDFNALGRTGAERSKA